VLRWQNEYLMRGYDVHDQVMTVLKAINTCFTVVTIIGLYYVYSLSLLFERIQSRERLPPPTCTLAAPVHEKRMRMRGTVTVCTNADACTRRLAA
jgi:hypothetical protein